ncbi:MAG: toll/interleukin-1 receptor domain-containing protein [Hyphomicrobiaceae bacterium]|nr:toll/interleukin-1 receptor domain-containing protein [Hyphomicrobiaceae bacterium]
MTNVFMSYSRRDAGLAARLTAAIKALGLDVFADHEAIGPGSDWRKSTQLAIRKSDAVVAVLSSPDAASNSWMSYELGMADAVGKQVLIVTPNQFSIRDLPSDMSSWRVMQFDPSRPDLAARDVVAHISRGAAE